MGECGIIDRDSIVPMQPETISIVMLQTLANIGNIKSVSIGIVNLSSLLTIDREQSTVNSQQSTVNSQQSTVNSQHHSGVTGNDIKSFNILESELQRLERGTY